MRASLIAYIVAASFILAGCASAPTTSSQQSSSAPAAETPRIAPAVAIPAASKKKVVLTMTGPRNVIEAKDWAEFKREWRETFGEHAKQAGIAYTFSDTEVKPSGEDGTILAVEVTDYRIVGIGARIFLGVMTGNAFIEAKVKALSLRDGTTFGEQQYSTSSSAWGGVFAKVTPQQVDSIATNIFRDLTSK